MPVDLFPPINLPEVVVATFYNGMPPQDIEVDITNPLERFFTQASGIDHMESRSLLGVSIIKAYFQPVSDAVLGAPIHPWPASIARQVVRMAQFLRS
jgi:hydrophobic/amphiphilic exporter-1 (mainly G- bacteria), HAE1 family